MMHKDSFESRFTKLHDAVEKVKKLKALDLSSISDTELANIINGYFNIIPWSSAIIPKGTSLFRARVNGVDNKPYNYERDIYSPPADKILKYGRANKPHERVFYCASNLELAAFEVLQDLKHKIAPKHEIAFITIGVWKTLEDLNVLPIIYDPKLHIERENIKKAFDETQKTLLNTMSLETAIAHKVILQFFAEEFTKAHIRNDSDYKISNFYISALRNANSFIAEKFASEKFDGINYPSVAMKYKGDNQALFIESADQKLEFTNALQVICHGFDFEKRELKADVLHESESVTNGNIIWKNEFYGQLAPLYLNLNF